MNKGEINGVCLWFDYSAVSTSLTQRLQQVISFRFFFICFSCVCFLQSHNRMPNPKSYYGFALYILHWPFLLLLFFAFYLHLETDTKIKTKLGLIKMSLHLQFRSFFICHLLVECLISIKLRQTFIAYVYKNVK